MKIKSLVLFLCLFLIIVTFGKDLNPFSKTMFEFHDSTQAARVHEFTLNLKSLKIPPRIAPDFYFTLGYPVFNFYAPTAYWITSIINLTGIDVVNSLKLSFLLAIVLSFIFSFLFLKNFFDYYPSLFGGIIYITTLYLPADIFVRGNLAEVWFITLLPLSLYFLYKNSKQPKPINLVIGIIVLSVTFTSHNLLSLIFIPISLIFVLLIKNKKTNVISIILALLLSSYFLLPLFLENHLIIATQMATKTRYQDHFLCINQLWDSPWGFGGSIKGCNDGMSFKLGKLQIIFALLGILMFILNPLRHSGKRGTSASRIVVNNDSGHPPAMQRTEALRAGAGMTLSKFFLFLTVFSLFFTLYSSQPIWDLFSPILAVFQFPWRFISFSMIGLSFFSAYFWHMIKIPYKSIIILTTIIILFITNTKYFEGKTIAKSDYEKKYLSQKYIEEEAAYQIPEYFAKFPNVKEKSIVNVPTQLTTNQTTTEKIGNLITLLTFVALGFILINKPLWKKMTS